MKEYLLVAKGTHYIWKQKSEKEWDQIMDSFGSWIQEMKDKKLWIRGDALTPKRVDLKKFTQDLQVHDGPFTETKELTGFFLFKAENMQQAIELSKDCPCLMHDSLSLHELEGDR